MKISKMKIKVAGLCLLTWAFVSTSCSDYLDKTSGRCYFHNLRGSVFQ